MERGSESQPCSSKAASVRATRTARAWRGQGGGTVFRHLWAGRGKPRIGRRANFCCSLLYISLYRKLLYKAESRCIRRYTRTRIASRPSGAIQLYSAIHGYTLYSYTALYTIQPLQHPSGLCNFVYCFTDTRVHPVTSDPGLTGVGFRLEHSPANGGKGAAAGRGAGRAGGGGGELVRCS